MVIYPPSAWERTMKIQEAFHRAYEGSVTWKEASELMGVDPRTIRRWKNTVEESGFEALLDRRTLRPSPKRAPERIRDKVLKLYRDLYREWNTKHFHEELKKLGVHYSYTWTKELLQTAGLVDRCAKKNKHRKKRQRRPLPGMMLHIDGSKHLWVPGLENSLDLIVVMDDATNEVYYAKLVPEENTRECMAAFKHVVGVKGLFCSVYSDRATHFFHTPKGEKKVDLSNLTQIGRAMYEIGIQMIPAYSPEARGRSERLFKTWQGRLPQELKLHRMKTLEDANQYIQETFLPWHNRELKKEASSEGSAFTPYVGKDLEEVFCVKEDRMVNHDNTIHWRKVMLQIEASPLRISFAKCRVTVCEHGDGTLSILYGPHLIGRYDASGEALKSTRRTNHLLQKADILTCY